MKLKRDTIFLFIVVATITYISISGYMHNLITSVLCTVGALVIALYIVTMNAIDQFPFLRDKNNSFVRMYNKLYGEEKE